MTDDDKKIMQKIKREYIAGKGSQRSLARKYGASISNVEKAAMREKWSELKKSAGRKAEEKTVEAVAAINSRSDEDFFCLVDQLVQLTSMSMQAACTQGVPTASQLEHYANAIGMIQKVKGIKSSLDTEEQKAKIAKLKKEVEAADQDQTGCISIDLGGAAAWAK